MVRSSSVGAEHKLLNAAQKILMSVIEKFMGTQLQLSAYLGHWSKDEMLVPLQDEKLSPILPPTRSNAFCDETRPLRLRLLQDIFSHLLHQFTVEEILYED